MSLFRPYKSRLPNAMEALPGREQALAIPPRHAVLDTPLAPPYPPGMAVARFGMGCFWGAERLYWTQPGVYVTAAGYAGGLTPNPTYDEVCSGRTGHAEVVQVVFDPARISYEDLLRIFWEAHDPTQGMRQGNDVGTQYRSLIQPMDETQRHQAQASRDAYQKRLAAAGFPAMTTEIAADGPFYFAEAEHQQYLAHHPNGYCGLRGTGVTCA
ncbi:MAG: peptide methionine sulfoxide reductase MsrA [Pseudomonadota bacterium]|jgi:peptide-methionine (S)-S-oxide reductase